MFDYRQPVVLAGCVYYLVSTNPPNLKIVPLWDITLYHILSLILMKFQVCRWALFFARRHFCRPYFCICLLVTFPTFCFFLLKFDSS